MDDLNRSQLGKAELQGGEADGQCDCACASVWSPTRLTAWIHLTTCCNLSCDYCYLASSGEHMSLETGCATVQAVFRSALAHGYGAVKLKYAGGEPTLRFPVLVELHRLAKRLAGQNGLDLDAVVLSNGVGITAKMLERLRTLGVRLSLSMDGLGRFHDCHRRLANGQGSFRAVSQTVDLALAVGLIPGISVTVSGRNVDGLPELVAWILERDLPFSLNFYRENDCSASQADLRLEDERLIAGMEATFKVVEQRLPERSLMASLLDRVNCAVPHTRTCGVGESYMVVDQRGRVSKCQMDIDSFVTDVYDPDPLSRIQASERGIQNLPVDDKLECSGCEWRDWCTGGCPLQTYRVTGRYDARSPYCEIYRALIPTVFHLEGLRRRKLVETSMQRSRPFSQPLAAWRYPLSPVYRNRGP